MLKVFSKVGGDKHNCYVAKSERVTVLRSLSMECVGSGRRGEGGKGGRGSGMRGGEEWGEEEWGGEGRSGEGSSPEITV